MMTTMLMGWSAVSPSRFLYTDEVEALHAHTGHGGGGGGGGGGGMDLEFALDLLAVADQFLVDALKRLCEGAIQKSISVENVSPVRKTKIPEQHTNTSCVDLGSIACVCILIF